MRSRTGRRALIHLEVLILRMRVAWDLRRRPIDAWIRSQSDAYHGVEPTASDHALTIEDIHRVTDLWLRRIPVTRATCLPRALVRYELLRRRGLVPTFVMGTRLAPTGELLAHAWVMLGDRPVMEREDVDVSEFTVTYYATATEGNAS